MRTGLLSDIGTVGYKISLEGNNIRLRYQGQGTPPVSAIPLIYELKSYKTEVVEALKMEGEIDVASAEELIDLNLAQRVGENIPGAAEIVPFPKCIKCQLYPHWDQILVDWFLSLRYPRSLSG